MANKPKNIAESVLARLRNISREKGQTFDLILVHYAIERLLYRLSKSQYANGFILKGAMLLMTWFDEPFRASRDLDFLGYGAPTEKRLIRIFKEVMQTQSEDGVVFNADDIQANIIREGNSYSGIRLKTSANIAKTRIPVSIDVGFGDAITPPPQQIKYPTFLQDMPEPELRGYARETVIAEKFQAIVALGMTNSRMKDYCDIWVLAKYTQVNSVHLAEAIKETFSLRKTDIPETTPDGLTNSFAMDPEKEKMWSDFSNDVEIAPESLEDVVRDLEGFLMPAAKMARNAK